VVVGFALGVTAMALPPSFDGNMAFAVMVPAAIGAVAAAAMVRWADRWVPADALGVALATVAVLLAAPGNPESPPTDGAVIALAFAYGFTLTAGLARLTDAGGRGIAGADVAGAAVLGFAALLLAEHIILPPGLFQSFEYVPMQLAQARTLAGAAVVLLALFAWSALPRRRQPTAVADAPIELEPPLASATR
jgi:hypothetical protein